MSAGTVQVALPPNASSEGGGEGDGGLSGRDIYSVGDVIAPDVVLATVLAVYADHVPRKFLPDMVKVSRAKAESGVYFQIKINGDMMFPGGAVLLQPGAEVTTIPSNLIRPEYLTHGLPVDARVEVDLTVVGSGYGFGAGDSEGLRVSTWGNWLAQI